jgi:nucleotidyltransferase/DNA polymerase involved in DNA repair
LKHLVGIGWKTASVLKDASIVTVADALVTPYKDIDRILAAGLKNGGETRARYIFLAARGLDETPLREKGREKVISVQDSMRQCNTVRAVEDYLRQMAVDLVIRLDEDTQSNNRRASRFTLRFRNNNNGAAGKSQRNFFLKWDTLSADMPIEISDADGGGSSLEVRAKILADALVAVFRRHYSAPFNMTSIAVVASHFINKKDGQQKQRSLKRMFLAAPASPPAISDARGQPPEQPWSRHVCDECGEVCSSERILIEHKDFHMASRLAAATPAERLAKRAKKGRGSLMSFFRVSADKQKI